MRYIECLDVKSFRGLRDVKIEDTGEINIFVGKNNSGKTSLLEAVRLFENPTEIGHYVHLSRSREARHISMPFGGLTPYESFINIFDKKNDKKYVEVSSIIYGKEINLVIEGHEEKVLKLFTEEHTSRSFRNENSIMDEEIPEFTGNSRLYMNGTEFKVEFTFNPYDKIIRIKNNKIPSLVKMNYVSPVDHYLQIYSLKNINSAIKAGSKSDIIEMLNIFDENITGFELIGEDRRTVPYLEHKQLGLMPLSTFGDGVRKALTLASAIVSLKGGVLLIDEIETAIHTKALKEFMDWFIRICKNYKVQVFITTHSIESIDAIIGGSSNFLEDIAGYRLENIDNRTYVSRFPGKKLHDIRYKLGLDVR